MIKCLNFPNRSCDIGRQRPEIARLRGEKRASSVRDLTGISSGNSAAVLCRGVNSEDSGTISDATSKNCRDTNWHSRLWLETEAAAAAVEASHSMLRPKKLKKKKSGLFVKYGCARNLKKCEHEVRM